MCARRFPQSRTCSTGSCSTWSRATPMGATSPARRSASPPRRGAPRAPGSRLSAFKAGFAPARLAWRQGWLTDIRNDLRAGRPTGRSAQDPASALGQELLELGAERRCDIGARQRVGDVGGEKADLRAAVEDAAVEAIAEERLGLGQLQHGVGHLNLAAGAGGLALEERENLGLQDVAAGDHVARGGVGGLGLLHHAGDAKALAAVLSDADDPVLVHLLAREDRKS